ncbi:uncharacterized protein LOC126841290 [Adelges cooleyi]|uniref:uncharacterized protein LOC126841290 n=1 Tax=Adelges cooleyi TaxID=133065 RepID=UPI00217FA1C6|nr:uncharacterized protein LOC126841290 [Adelges cooleyi]
MIFKLSIVLIYFIVAASCTITEQPEPSPKTDEEVIQESFDHCLKWTNNGIDPTPDHILTVTLLTFYLGGNSFNNLKVIDDYFVANPSKKENLETAGIGKKLYGDIFKFFCKSYHSILTFQRCAESKKNAMTLTTLKELKTFYRVMAFNAINSK